MFFDNALGDSARRMGTTSTTSGASSGIQTGRIGADSSAHRASPGSINIADLDGLDLSLGSCAGGTVGKAKCESQGGCAGKGPRSAGLGPKRKVSGQFSPGAHHDERQARLDAKTGRCLFGGPKKGFGYN